MENGRWKMDGMMVHFPFALLHFTLKRKTHVKIWKKWQLIDAIESKAIHVKDISPIKYVCCAKIGFQGCSWIDVIFVFDPNIETCKIG